MTKKKKKTELEDTDVRNEYSDASLEAEPETESTVADDPRYTILKDSLKALVDESPPLEKVQQNPWLFLEWRNRIAQLVS